jgi:hypothetical protein
VVPEVCLSGGVFERQTTFDHATGISIENDSGVLRPSLTFHTEQARRQLKQQGRLVKAHHLLGPAMHR